MFFKFFSNHNLSNFFNQICQTVNEIINGTIQQNNQLQSSISFFYEATSTFCHGNSCTHQNHYCGYKRLVVHWINLLTSQLKNCFLQEDNGINNIASNSPTIISCDSRFNHSAFINGLVGAFIICTGIYLAVYCVKKFTPNQALRARNNIYTPFKGGGEATSSTYF
ncbi:hypothetical protein K6025_05250 [Ehrlichia sp. JZT12]